MWVPQSSSELEQAVQQQAVVESLFLDFKRFPDQSNSGNKELAKDIAALSIEGGMLVLGVDELAAEGVFSLKPQELIGWKERLSQIGLNRVQPPVRVTCRSLDNRPGFGYLLVQVPASSRAPHMVGGRYYGRADTTNYQLADREVRALIARAQERRHAVAGLLVDEVARDPTPDVARNSRLFVVAQPVSANTTLLLDSIPSRDLADSHHMLASRPVLAKPASYTPTFGHLQSVYRRANGVASSSFHMTSARASTAATRNDVMSLIDLELQEDGGIRLLYGRASDTETGRRGEKLLIVDGILSMVSRVIELARVVSKLTDFTGSWQLGMSLVKLYGTQTPESSRNIPERQSLYDRDAYSSTTEADQIRLYEPGSPILDELAGRFLRSVCDGSLDVGSYDEFGITHD